MKFRVLLEAAAWTVLVAVLWGTDLSARLAEVDQVGYGKTSYRLVVEQITSGLAVLAMIPFVVRWLTAFPLRRDAWLSAIIGHIAGSAIFAFGHYTIMVLLRGAWYGLAGRPYVWREPFLNNLLVEFQKDIKIYLGIVFIVAAYRYYRQSGTVEQAPASDRLLVQTSSGDAVVRLDEIDYLEAAKNYVSVFANDREFVVRETMAGLEKRFSGRPFARIHRSYIVNVDKVREIRTTDGKQYACMQIGAELPVSRTYREAFRQRFEALGT